MSATDSQDKTKPMPEVTLDTFAEHLANGMSVGDASRAMGFHYDYGNALMRRIRRRLGWQAV